MTTTPTQRLAFDANAVGVWGPEHRFVVTSERIIEYARATNDPIAAHLAGQIAPPVFAVVPAFAAVLPAAFTVAPEALMSSVLHGEQDFTFHSPIRPGMTLISRAKPLGFEGKKSGTRATVFLETRDDVGGLVNEQWTTLFFRGFDAGPAVGEGGRGHVIGQGLAMRPPLRQVTQHVDHDQTFRYSPAAGDLMRIHLDEDFAKAAGLPGIIAHGLCTLAMSSWAALTQLADADVTRLHRLAVRFSRPVLPGQDITTSFWQSDRSAESTTYSFQTAVADVTVLTDGLAEIRR